MKEIKRQIYSRRIALKDRYSRIIALKDRYSRIIALKDRYTVWHRRIALKDTICTLPLGTHPICIIGFNRQKKWV
jgi:hypothetical protein